MDLGLLDEGQPRPLHRGPARPASCAPGRAPAWSPSSARRRPAGRAQRPQRAAARPAPSPATSPPGPSAPSPRLEELFDELLAGSREGPPWGVGVGLPGPVEFASGPARRAADHAGLGRLPGARAPGGAYGVPAWVDNDVNVMALGELRAGSALATGRRLRQGRHRHRRRAHSRGRLHRGAQGAPATSATSRCRRRASVLCRCGNTGCLEAAGRRRRAGPRRPARRAPAAAAARAVLEANGHRDGARCHRGAARRRPGEHRAAHTAGRLVGRVLAALVNFYNPSLIVMGGQVSAGDDLFLSDPGARSTAARPPLAARDLRIKTSPLGDRAGCSVPRSSSPSLG